MSLVFGMLWESRNRIFNEKSCKNVTNPYIKHCVIGVLCVGRDESVGSPISKYHSLLDLPCTRV